MSTISTPWGCYRWTRLQFKISSASEEWQCSIHLVLEDLPTISIADDILDPGCGTTDVKARIDHDCNLIVVLQHFEKHFAKLFTNKMRFLFARPISWVTSSLLKVLSPTQPLSVPFSTCLPHWTNLGSAYH